MKEIKSTKSKATKTVAKAAPAKASVVARPARKTSVKAAPAITGATATASVAPAPAIPAPRREITTELIAQRAYVIWEQQGRPHGHEEANWLLAEKQLRQEIQSFTA
jgi:hypothetical protein